MKNKKRLDMLLVERNYVNSREKAKRLTMAGMVYVDSQMVDKAGTDVSISADIQIKGNDCPYVSRGGLKLDKAINLWNLKIQNSICMDIGASTGGFTDCMLEHGANKVYAIDVGYGQLDWKLRQDSRVINLERTNIRYFDLDSIDEDILFISIDVSFISLKLVLPVAYKALVMGGEIVFLIKPQFEVGKQEASKNKGVITSKDSHKKVLEDILKFSVKCGFSIKGVDFSPITGAAGNIEFLAYAQKSDNLNKYDLIDEIAAVVETAHNQLN